MQDGNLLYCNASRAIANGTRTARYKTTEMTTVVAKASLSEPARFDMS